MKHPSVDSNRLARQIGVAISRTGKPIKQIARSAGMDPSRVSRFCNGDFKRVTPVLERLCTKLKVKWKDYLHAGKEFDLQNDLMRSVHRIVEKSPDKVKALRRLIRSVETLVESEK